MKPLMFFCLALGMLAIAQDAPRISAADAEKKIRYDVRQMLRPAGEVYRDLFLEGPSAERYQRLGDMFYDEEKPFQAKFYYEMALALQPDSEAAKNGLDRASERIKYLNDRFRMYSDKANNGGEPTNFGSMAAIKFHQGFQNEAFDILKDAISLYGPDARVAPLADTFQKDIAFRVGILDELVTRYRGIDLDENPGQGLEILGQMIFVSYGNPDVLTLFEELKKSRPNLVNEESYLLLREFTRTYPNRKS